MIMFIIIENFTIIIVIKHIFTDTRPSSKT